MCSTDYEVSLGPDSLVNFRPSPIIWMIWQNYLLKIIPLAKAYQLAQVGVDIWALKFQDMNFKGANTQDQQET